jgi:hypothetical protein
MWPLAKLCRGLRLGGDLELPCRGVPSGVCLIPSQLSTSAVALSLHGGERAILVRHGLPHPTMLNLICLKI